MLLTASLWILAVHQKAAVWKVQTFSEGVRIEAPVLKKLKPFQAVNDPAMASTELWGGTDGPTSFVVSVSRLRDPAKADTAALFNGSVAGLLSESKGRLVGQRDIILQGWPGVATTFREGDGLTFAGRMFRTKKQLILIGATYATILGRSPKVDRFLNSLNLGTPGEQNEPGPILSRFPMGDSGLTALFPGVPHRMEGLVGKKANTATLFSFSSTYALRTFTVSYLDIPTEENPSENETDKARYDFTESILGEAKGKKGKQSDLMVGDTQALLTEFTTSEGDRGQLLVYFLGKRAILVFEGSPIGYSAPKAVKDFMRSVQASPTGGGSN